MLHLAAMTYASLPLDAAAVPLQRMILALHYLDHLSAWSNA